MNGRVEPHFYDNFTKKIPTSEQAKTDKSDRQTNEQMNNERTDQCQHKSVFPPQMSSGVGQRGSTSFPNGASSKMAAPSSPASSHGRLGVASGLLHSLEQRRDHVAEIDPALTSQFTAQELRDLRMVFDTFDKDRKG